MTSTTLEPPAALAEPAADAASATAASDSAAPARPAANRAVWTGFAVVLAAVWIANSYPWPAALAQQYAAQHGITLPPGGIPTGIAFPVVIMLLVGLAMTYLATRRRFGRYVYAIGGNPDAAELGGINVRRTIMLTFVLMGVLCAISAAVQTARLNAAVTNLGVQNELDVISAAVIGGTSFAGGIGTIGGKAAPDYAAGLVAELQSFGNVILMPRTTIFGWYDDMVFGALELPMAGSLSLRANQAAVSAAPGSGCGVVVARGT